VELIGETGKKLHRRGSRNEQIATTCGCSVRDSVDDLRAVAGDLLDSLLTVQTKLKNGGYARLYTPTSGRSRC